MNDIEVYVKKRKILKNNEIELFNLKKSKEILNYHQSFKEYKVTPLVELNSLAEKIGVSKIFVKDESKRFGLNAFKALGGSYGIANAIAKELGYDIKDITLDLLTSPEIK